MVGSQIFEILSLIIGLALISMLVQRSGEAVKLVEGTSGAFGDLLQAATNASSGPIRSYNRRYGR